MTDEPIENLAYDFLEERFAAAPVGDLLKTLELHDTLFKKIEKPAGVRVGDGASDFSVNTQDEIQEYDAVLILVCYALIEGGDKTERRAARTKAFQISRAVARLFIGDETMNGRVCRSRLLTAARGFDSINSKPYAVVNMPIVFNESGDINFHRRREGY